MLYCILVLYCVVFAYCTVMYLCFQLVDLDMSFDLSVCGDVTYDIAAARQEFHNKLNKQILDICLKMMVDLFSDIHNHIIPDQKFFNRVSLLITFLGCSLYYPVGPTADIIAGHLISLC